MENPMLDFEMEQWEKLKKSFYEGYEAGKKDAEYYALHCGDTDEPFTNADRIRAMSDIELAKALSKIHGTCVWCPVHEDCDGENCDGQLLDWLKEVSE